MQETIIQLLMAFIGSLGFALIFHLRCRLLLPASIGGLLSWGAYLLGMYGWQNVFLACLAASAFAAFFSEVLARILKAPTPLFFIPAVIPLIPGNPIFQTMSCIVREDWPTAQSYAFLTIQYALSIALGISLIWAFFIMGTRLQFYVKNRKLLRPK